MHALGCLISYNLISLSPISLTPFSHQEGWFEKAGRGLGKVVGLKKRAPHFGDLIFHKNEKQPFKNIIKHVSPRGCQALRYRIVIDSILTRA